MNKLTINNIILPFLLLGIFFIPFNSWSGIGFLGEYYRDSCFLFFSFAFVLTLFKRKIQIPLNNLIFQFFNFIYSMGAIGNDIKCQQYFGILF